MFKINVLFIARLIQLASFIYIGYELSKIEHAAVFWHVLLFMISAVYIDFKFDPLIEEKKSNEKFGNFLYLPPELRMMIIDEMELRDRSRFSQCSKMCNNQVKESKNGIHELEFEMCPGFATISVYYNFRGNFAGGFKLVFHNEINKKYMNCETIEREILWVTELTGPMDVEEHGLQHFKSMLKLYQTKIKRLGMHLTTSRSNYSDFEIKKLSNLEEILLFDGIDVQQLLSKTRKNLILLMVPGRNGENLGDCEQIYRVQKTIDCRYTRLNYEQFLRLTAPKVSIHIGLLTEQDIFKFVRSWQDGSIDKDVDMYTWYLDESVFDVEKLFTLLGAEYDLESRNKQHDIQHKRRAGISASIFTSYYQNSLQFLVHYSNYYR